MKILFISLGCDKNLTDTEVMLGLIASKGYEMTDDEAEADVIIINSCCFIEDAKEESIQNILEMAKYKEKGSLKALIVTGCLAQRYKKEIIDEIPEVDAVLGTTSYDRILEAIDDALKKKSRVIMDDINRMPHPPVKRVLTTGGHYAYLKIAEGCDKHCTYCIIPKVRGDFRSVPMESLVAEAEYLAGEGVRELIVVAQETTLYGADIYGKKCLPDLLRRLCGVDGIRWIRLLYCYPEDITDELIEVMRDEKKICHYIDIPIQHANDEILRRMGRRTCKKEICEIIAELRRRIPDICIRTTLISGFPGETEGQHEELMDFVDETEFDRLGVFTYSQEEGTPAAQMDGQIDEKTKQKRQSDLMGLQQEIAFSHAQAMSGRELDVMIEGRLTEEDVYVGRTYMDAPGVDGLIFIDTDEELESGDFVRAAVTGAAGYDLTGGIVQ